MHVLSNFKIGETVVLVNNSKLVFIITDIDKENGLIICSISGIPEVAGRFKPEELDKVKPSNSHGHLNYETSDE